MDNINSSERVQTECRADQFARPGFNSGQSSQLFINCCFALSFSGVFFIVNEAFRTTAANLFWVPLAIYLIFNIWRQYSIYYIPLQFYRNKPESDSEELVTLVITLFLAAFCLICIYAPRFSLLSLLIILGLNLIKVSQMRKTLSSAPNPPLLAAAELSAFRNKLWIYVGVVFIMMTVVWMADLTGFRYYVVVGLLPLPIHFIARWIYDDFFGKRPTPNPADTYIESVAEAWNRSYAEETHNGQR